MKVTDRRNVIARRLAVASAALVGTALTPLSASAQDSTWTGPGTDYVEGANWIGGIPTNRGTFTNMGPTNVVIPFNEQINEIVFDANAPGYSITNDAIFAVNGPGITNQSGAYQTFTNRDTLTFNNNALVTGGAAGLALDNGPPLPGDTAIMVFNGNSGIDADVDLSNSAGGASAVGNVMIGGDANIIFNDTSYADGADLRFFGGTGAATGGAGVSATGIGGISSVSFRDASHADNAAIGNVGGGAIAIAGGDPLSSATGIGGGAQLFFSDSAHADGSTFTNIDGNAVAVGGSGGAGPATAISGTALIVFSNDSHADNATFNNVSAVTTAIGGSGTLGTPGGTGASGGSATAIGGGATIVFNDNSHADNATFFNTNSGITLIGGGGGAGDTGAGGTGGIATGVSGGVSVIFNGNSHADNAVFTNTSLGVTAVGGTGGAGGSAGVGGQGGLASGASGGTYLEFSNATGITGATIDNIAGNALAGGGTGGAGGTGAAGGRGGDAVASGGGATILFTGTASAGTGTTIVNQGGDGTAFGGTGGSGGTGAAGVGGQGGNASANGGDALVNFQDNASAGNATITNTAGTGSITGGSGGNGNTGNGGEGGDAQAQGGDAIVRFDDNATAGNATIVNNAGAPLTANGGGTGADGVGGGIGGAAGGGSVSSGLALIEFNDTATGGGANITNNGGQTRFNDSSVFGTAAGALITNNLFGTTVFNDMSSLGTGTIQNNAGGSTQFRDSATAGSGTINIAGAGFTAFFDNSNAGSATINNATGGNLQFVGNSSAGSALINNDGSLSFTTTSDAVGARVVNGAGGAIAISVNGFRLGSLSGGGTVNNFGNTIQIGYLDLNDVFSGVISGNGGLIKRGTGTLVLTGTNTYAGGTTIAEGTLQIGNGGTTGSVTGDILNNGALIFDRSNSIVYGDVISGSGTLTKNGTGTLVLTGENTYAGVTTVNQGILQIGLIGTTGSVAGDIVLNNDSRLAFSRTDDYSYGGVISGTGSMTKVGPGTLTLTGNNSYTGGTAIAGGTLQIGNGGTTGALAGNVAVGTGSTLAFNRSNTLGFGGNITGGGQLNKLGAGTLILTGDASHTGGTTISQGVLQIGNGGTSGSIAGDIVNNATLAFSRADALTYGGVVSGTGSLIQLGAGTLTLTGANSYGGGTFVNAGTLQLNGSVASAVTVAAAGRLSGTGIVNGNLVANGVVAPGSTGTPLGTLTVTGNAAFNAGSILAPTITSGGASSLLQAGSLTINAGTVRPTAVTGGLFLMQTDYRLAVGTGGRTGTFGGVDESLLPSFLDASLFYTPTEVFLRVRRNATNFAQTAGLTPNQNALSTALDAAVTAGDPDVFGTYLTTYNTLLALGTNGPLQAALNTLSGDALTAVPVTVQGQSSRFAHRLDSYTWSNSSNVWGLIAYGDQDADTDGNGPGFNADGLEFQVGFNTSLGANTRLGLSAGYNDADIDLKGRAATANVETWSLGAHLRHDFGPAYVSGQLTYSWHSIDTTRALLLGGSAGADFDANTWTGALEVGGVFRTGQLSIEPHVSIRHASTDQDAYSEAGPVGVLNVAAADYETTRFGLGVRLANREPTAPVRFHALIRYEHETGDSVAALDNMLPGLPSFRVFGPRLGDDILTADVGVEFQLSQGLSLFASGGGHTRSNETSLNANAGLRIRF